MRLALAANGGSCGSSGRGGAAALSACSSEVRASEPSPTPQSRKNQRRDNCVAASVRRLLFMGLTVGLSVLFRLTPSRRRRLAVKRRLSLGYCRIEIQQNSGHDGPNGGIVWGCTGGQIGWFTEFVKRDVCRLEFAGRESRSASFGQAEYFCKLGVVGYSSRTEPEPVRHALSVC